MADQIRFAAPVYEGGRRCLLCGSVTMGAVFPPTSDKAGRNHWRWSLFPFGANGAHEGRAKDEATAKGHLLAAFAITLAEAGLTPIATEADHG